MTVLPPVPAAGTPPQPAPSPAALPGVLIVVDAPAEVVALPLGARIDGAILSGGTGAIAIRTALGTVIVDSPVALPKGAPVALMVQAAAPGMVLRIIQMASLQREPPIVAATSGQGASAPPSLFERNAPGAPPASVRAAGMAAAARGHVEAIVLRPLPATTFGAMAGPADAAAAPGTHAPLPAGTRLSVRILPAAPAQASSGPSAGGSPPLTTQVGAGQTITASVVGIDGAGRPLLVSSAGSLVLTAPVNLPPQWSGALEVLDLLPPPSADLRAAREQPGGSPSLTDWRALEQVLGVLSEADPAAARHVRDTVLPQPTSSLAANILKVLGLLRHGDLRGWIGDDAYRTLAARQPDLLEQLGADLRKLAPPAAAGGGDWRIFTLPLVVDGALAPITMLIRDRPQSDQPNGGNDGDSTRFVFDLALSRLGRMQIDGLLQAHGKQLDLIVRTERPLGADVQGGIRAVVTEAAAVTGLRAAVGFRAAPAQFLDAAALAGTGAHVRRNLVI